MSSYIIDLLDSDDDDDLLLDRKPVFAVKTEPSTSSTTSSTSAATTPKAELLTVLGTFKTVVALTKSVPTTMELSLVRDKENIHNRHAIRIVTPSNETIGVVPFADAMMLAPILDNMSDKIGAAANSWGVGNAVNSVTLKVKANRILSSYERKPYEDRVRHHLGNKFTRFAAPKPPPKPVPDLTAPMPTPTAATTSEQSQGITPFPPLGPPATTREQSQGITPFPPLGPPATHGEQPQGITPFPPRGPPATTGEQPQGVTAFPPLGPSATTSEHPQGVTPFPPLGPPATNGEQPQGVTLFPLLGPPVAPTPAPALSAILGKVNVPLQVVHTSGSEMIGSGCVVNLKHLAPSMIQVFSRSAKQLVGYIEGHHAAKLIPSLTGFKETLLIYGEIKCEDDAASKTVCVHFAIKSSLGMSTERTAAFQNMLREQFGDHFEQGGPLTGGNPRFNALSSVVRGLSDMMGDGGIVVDKIASNSEGQIDFLDEMFDELALKQVELLPDYPIPPLLSHMQLFDHQKVGIRWLIHQERGEIPSYIEELEANGRKLWKCIITKVTMPNKPEPVRGGILADDMGLGKTLQTLGLILSNPPEGHSYPCKNRQVRNRNAAPRCTLIVCPLSVMATWMVEITKHVNQGKKNKNLTAMIYHGPKRDDILVLVEKGDVDVLLASYHTLSADYRTCFGEEDEEKPRLVKKPRKGPRIFDVSFHRIVLDEAHIIRSSQTGFFKATREISFKSARKLCLTGTPFVNKPTDIHSLLSFLAVKPLSHSHVFRELVEDAIKSRKEVGLARIRTTMAHITLRRRKEQVDTQIDLVKKTVYKYLIAFVPDSEHKATYDALYEAVRSYFLDILQNEGHEAFYHFMEILALTLRIRQACCHVSLVPERLRAGLKEAVAKGLDTKEAQALLKQLLGALEDPQLVECAVCMNELEEENAAILRDCKHIFCEPCLNQIQNSKCPMCRAPYTSDDVVKKKTAEQAATTKVSPEFNLAQHGRSPKIQAMLNLIDKMKPGEKGVIFSQWTSVLDLIAVEFRRLGHTFTRIDGTMNVHERIDAMEAFDTEGCFSMREPRFILCSLHACGTGINLTRGNVVFMFDVWWNVAAENQAMDRVHRISQKREVRVYRLLMKDSLEEKMVALQDAKAMLGKGSLEKLQPEEKRKARLTALMDLFSITEEEVDWT